MKNFVVRKSVGCIAISMALSSALVSSALSAADETSKNPVVLDKTHFPASNFLAYTEFELSGEPLAEALGLDLDILDPNLANQPTAFDFQAGIAAYEYSEEAMYALNYQSTMGPHLVNGPLNTKRGGGLKQLNARIEALAAAVGFDVAEIPANMYLLSLPYVSGSPEFAQQPDAKLLEGEMLEITTSRGITKKVNAQVPAYTQDFKSLAWDAKSFDKSFNPAAIGGIFLKEVMWSQDFLGGMHVTETDEEVEAHSSKMDLDGKHSLGVSAADGFNGMILTEMSIDKLLILQNQLGFDGKQLGAKFNPNYSAQNGPVWFANKVSVVQGNQNGVNSIDDLKVTNPSSNLRDSWQMLWPLAEFYAFTDQRKANTSQNPAMLAVFDGAPFAAAPEVNTDADESNDIVAEDAFSLANNISNLVFENMMALHFNPKQGTFVTEYNNSSQGNQVNTFDAAYSIVALSIYQRAKDALPVGYASADDGAVNLNTADGKKALSILTAQADFLIERLVTANGLVADGLELGNNEQRTDQTSLETQFAAIRGLTAAFVSTGNAKYKKAARSIYLAVEKHLFDKTINTWATQPGKATIHTPYTQAAISGGLREALLHLKNQEGENVPELEVKALTNRYVSWFTKVINGAMQLAEPYADTGEFPVKGDNSGDTDEDGVRQITAAGGQFGTATTMANRALIK